MTSFGDSRRPRIGLLLAGALALFAILGFVFSCTSDGGEKSRQIRFDLADSLANYPKVSITVVDFQDTARTLDTAFFGKLTTPKAISQYRIPDSIGGDFRIRIQGFDSAGLLVLQSDIEVKSGSAAAAVKVAPEKLPGVVAAMPAARLAGLDISAGTLDPAFRPGIFSYAVHAAFESDSLSVNATAVDSQSALTLEDMTLKSGVPSARKALKPGEQIFKVGVLPKGGSLANFYVLIVRRDAADEARLDSIRISAGQATFKFHPDSINLAAEVGDETESIVVRPFVRDSKAKVEVDGIVTDTLLGKLAELKPEVTTTITLKVTSRDGTKVKTYFLKVLRRPSTDAALSGLVVQSSTLAPTFDPDVDKYGAMLTSDLVSITPKVRKTGSKITINGKDAVSGQIFQIVLGAVGSTSAIITVTAPDAKTKKTYTLALNKLNPDVYLAGISVNGATLDSTFLPTRFHYNSQVSRDIGQILVNAQTGEKPVSVSGSINGFTLTAGAAFVAGGLRFVPFTAPLKVGLNTIALESTGPDNTSKCVYSIDITRLPSTITNLDSLTIGASVLSPPFAATTTSYKDTLSSFSIFATVKARPVDTVGASVVLRLKRSSPGSVPPKYVLISADTLFPPKFSRALLLEPRTNIVEVEVLAENRTSRKTYTIEVWKKLSNIFSLDTLAIKTTGNGAVELKPAFAATTASYTASTGLGFVTITPKTIPFTGAKVTVNGYAVESGIASNPIALQMGPNKITVHCIAENDTTNGDYILNVTRTSIPGL